MLAACLAALAVAPGASALECPNTPLEDRLEAADAAFVGRVTGERPAVSGEGRVYRFVVDQTVKGPVGREAEVRSARPLVDAEDRPILHDEAIGVLASLSGAELTTTSCLLTDPGALLSVSDEPRGNAIKLVIGFVVLAAVLGYSALRLRKRQARVGAGGRLDR